MKIKPWKLTRRNLLILLGIATFFVLMVITSRFWYFRKIYYKLESLFQKKDEKSNREFVQKSPYEIPKEAQNITIEMALNSRCTSDYDGDQNKFHWGLFDECKSISEDQIREIINWAKIPRFTNERAEIRYENNSLSFIIEAQKEGIIKEHLMVESGMQQQAICLTCAALGIGMVFKSSTENGLKISDKDHENIKIKLDAMKPSYNGSFWTNKSPSECKSWCRDNLPIPDRSGKKSFLVTLKELEKETIIGKKADIKLIGQLLWAARGRTPHLYKSKPWGMTIPTWRGEQNLTYIFLLMEGDLFKYVNWKWGGWSHSIKKIKKIEMELWKDLYNFSTCFNASIILAKNDSFSRALWECGYQLLNLMLQANALELKFSTLLFDEKLKKKCQRIGIKEAVCGLFIEKAS